MEILFAELEWLFFIVKIILAISCGFAIGIERETMGKPAGIKTHTLICLGSCLFTHFSLMATEGDPTRIAAQVVSGIGFIGAGTILQSKQRIEGLTSASLVFVNAAIGMLIGGNYFMYSIIATTALLILFYLIRTNRYQSHLRSYRIYIKCENYHDIEQTVFFINKLNCKITNKKIEKKKRYLELNITYLTTPLANHRILSKLHKLNTIDTFTQI
jgi:putative Mg2+ transporter-C (MgtC) family protein